MKNNESVYSSNNYCQFTNKKINEYQGITEKTGQEILKALREIIQLLQQM